MKSTLFCIDGFRILWYSIYIGRAFFRHGSCTPLRSGRWPLADVSSAVGREGKLPFICISAGVVFSLAPHRQRLKLMRIKKPGHPLPLYRSLVWVRPVSSDHKREVYLFARLPIICAQALYIMETVTAHPLGGYRNVLLIHFLKLSLCHCPAAVTLHHREEYCHSMRPLCKESQHSSCRFYSYFIIGTLDASTPRFDGSF